MLTKRLVICAQDIARIVGVSTSTGRRLLVRIKQAKGKQSHQYLTVEEFCDYTALPLDKVSKYL